MRNVCKAWNRYWKEVCLANTQLCMKITPKLRDFAAKNEQMSGYYGKNNAWVWIQFTAKLFQSLIQLISKIYTT